MGKAELYNQMSFCTISRGQCEMAFVKSNKPMLESRFVKCMRERSGFRPLSLSYEWLHSLN